jgi:hypothetical protein
MPSQIGMRKMHNVFKEEVANAKSFDCTQAEIVPKTIETLTLEWTEGEFTRSKYVAFNPTVPINVYRTNSHSYFITFKAFIQDFAAEDQTKIQEYASTLLERRKKNNEAENDYRHKVRDLLARCNTLKQLLEVWPAAENLVPSEYVVKLHEKVTRKQRAQSVKEEINFNPEDVNHVVLTAKLLGG